LRWPSRGWARVKYADCVKTLARLALAVEMMGNYARREAGPADRCDTAVEEARAEHADRVPP
jgi:hypothetical protein